MDLLIARLERYPSMHVYHYAPYEPTALKRAQGRHATREEEVDRLLRGGVLVDLFRVVRQGMRASRRELLDQALEPLYGLAREVDLRDAGSSIVAFEDVARARETVNGAARRGHPATPSRATTATTSSARWRLRDWLEERRWRARGRSWTGRFPAAAPASAEPTRAAHDEAASAGRGGRDAPDRRHPGRPRRTRTDAQGATWLLAQLLSWHRREQKATYWEFFHRIGAWTATSSSRTTRPLGRLEVIGDGRRAMAARQARQLRRTGATGSRSRSTTSVTARSCTTRPAAGAPGRRWKAVAHRCGAGRDRRSDGNRRPSSWPADSEPRASRGARPARHHRDPDHRALAAAPRRVGRRRTGSTPTDPAGAPAATCCSSCRRAAASRRALRCATTARRTSQAACRAGRRPRWRHARHPGPARSRARRTPGRG